MFSGLMANAWEVATMVAVVAGVVGFFVVLRGSSFVAHAVPNSAFAGAAGAALVGVNTLAGLGLFALVGALGIGGLSRRGRQDVATALAVVVMLGLGVLFLSWNGQYASETYSLLFGDVLGVSVNQIDTTAALGAVVVAGVAVLYRPLLLASTSPDLAEARGLSAGLMELLFLVAVAAAATMAVPVVGALLMFSLMVGPPAAARCLATRPPVVIALSVAIALATVWAAIAASYLTDWPIGFFVGVLGAVFYLGGRAWAAWRRRRVGGGAQPGGPALRASKA